MAKSAPQLFLPQSHHDWPATPGAASLWDAEALFDGDFFGTAEPNCFAWDGTTWTPGAVKAWDGAAWVPTTAQRWDGASWDVL